jgi:hypothetical protein
MELTAINKQQTGSNSQVELNVGPVDPFFDDVFELDVFIQVTIEGHGYTTIAPDVTRFIKRSGARGHPVADDSVYRDRLERQQQLKGFAEREIEQGHPYLYSLATVRLWSILEAAIDEVILGLLRRGGWDESSGVTQLTGPLLPFLEATEETRAELLREKLLEAHKNSERIGVGRFESVLSPLGLGGAVDTEVRKRLLELSEVRHVIVHRRGIADRKLLLRCPWLPWDIGATAVIRRDRYASFYGSVLWYLMEIAARWLDETEQPDGASEFRTMQAEVLDRFFRETPTDIEQEDA